MRLGLASRAHPAPGLTPSHYPAPTATGNDSAMSIDLETALSRRLDELDLPTLHAQFMAQNEFIAVENFLPAACLNPLLDALPALEPRVHRNYIPRHKKGGSISRHDLDQFAPDYAALYRSSSLRTVLGALTGAPLQECPGNDPHTYALYYYTEAGDHIGYHYDTSYYKGARYTILLGLVDQSSCRLEYQLYKDVPGKTMREESISLAPGTLVVFNGDRLYHRVTPSAAGERRVALTLEYVTSPRMHPVRRFVSNMKDAIAYFGFRQVFRPGRS